MPFLPPNQQRQSTEGTITENVIKFLVNAYSALTLSVGRQEELPVCKN